MYSVVTAYADGYCKSETAENYPAAISAAAIYAMDDEWWHTYIFDENDNMIAKIEAPL